MTGSDLWRALRLLQIDVRRVGMAVTAGFVALGSALALAAVAAWLIARAWQMPPVLDLSVAVVSVRALGISRGLFRYLERLATHDTAFRGTTAARAGIYRRLAAGDPAAVTSLRRGDLLTQTGEDVDTVGEVVIRALVPIAVAVALSVAAIGLLAVISPAAALVLAVSLLVAGVVAPVMSARAAAAAEHAAMASSARYAGDAVTALDHAAELRIAGRLDDLVSVARTGARAAADATDRSARRLARAAAATPLAIGASVLGSLLIGITLYGTDSGSITPMAFAMLVLVPLSAFEAVGPLPAAATALTRAHVAAGRIMAMLDRSVPVSAGTPMPMPAGHALKARGLVCGWPGAKQTVPTDLDLWPGARIAVVGPSGAGKTTTLMTLAGLLPPVDGDVSFGGCAIADLDPADVRHRVTFFAEDAHLFETSLLENLRVARGELDEPAAGQALKSVGLGEWLDGLPDGLQTVLVGGDRAVSGGQRRRILLARALVSPADVLLLDEPTEHLDATDGARLLGDLLDRGSGLVEPHRSVVVVTHNTGGFAARARVLSLSG